MSDVTTGQRILAYGQKAVRQGNKATRPPGKKAPPAARPAATPAHVRLARKVWKAHFAQAKYGSTVAIDDFSKAPDKGVASSTAFAAWTNSGTQVFVRNVPGADATFWAAALFHEHLHVVQFMDEGRGKPPSTYETMMEYERDAYSDSATWAKKDVPQGVSAYATHFQKTADGYVAELARVRGLPAGTDVEKHYKAYLEKEGLPRAASIADLYTAP